MTATSPLPADTAKTGGRSQLPGTRGRRLLGAGGLALLLALVAFGAWQGGRNAATWSSDSSLRDRIKALEAENRAVAERLAHLQTNARVDRQTYTQLEGQLADLQDKIIEQQEELAFYRGIVGGPGSSGIQVRDFSLHLLSSSAVQLRFVLTRLERAGQSVRGRVEVRIEGVRSGRPASLDLSSLATTDAGRSLSFDLRYFQEMQAELKVPDGFAPQRVVIRVLPANGRMKPSVESYPWSPQPS
jgi:hypothetical protein